MGFGRPPEPLTKHDQPKVPRAAGVTPPQGGTVRHGNTIIDTNTGLRLDTTTLCRSSTPGRGVLKRMQSSICEGTVFLTSQSEGSSFLTNQTFHCLPTPLQLSTDIWQWVNPRRQATEPAWWSTRRRASTGPRPA
jgi:hypothetical protein